MLFSSHGGNDFVASTKRFVNLASANQNCWGDKFICYGDNCNCCGDNSYCCCNIWNCHHNNSGLLRLYEQNVLLRQQSPLLRARLWTIIFPAALFFALFFKKSAEIYFIFFKSKDSGSFMVIIIRILTLKNRTINLIYILSHFCFPWKHRNFIDAV